VREVTEFTYTFTTKQPTWPSILNGKKKQVSVALELKYQMQLAAVQFALLQL
jgi:hypothetical protein